MRLRQGEGFDAELIPLVTSANVRGRSLMGDLPGKPSAIRDCLMAEFPAIPYCIDPLEGPYSTTGIPQEKWTQD